MILQNDHYTETQQLRNTHFWPNSLFQPNCHASCVPFRRVAWRTDCCPRGHLAQSVSVVTNGVNTPDCPWTPLKVAANHSFPLCGSRVFFLVWPCSARPCIAGGGTLRGQGGGRSQRGGRRESREVEGHLEAREEGRCWGAGPQECPRDASLRPLTALPPQATWRGHRANTMHLRHLPPPSISLKDLEKLFWAVHVSFSWSK